MNLSEKQLKKEYIYNGKIINVRRDEARLPNSATALREVVEHPGGVSVLPLDEDNNVYFVRQFRYPYFEEILEIPAGKRDRKGEEPLDCGKRELKEEIGALAEDYTFLGEVYPTPGYCDEIIFIYLAKGLTFSECEPDEDEFVETVKMPIEKAVEAVLSGEIKDAKTQIAVLKTKILLESGKF